MRNIFVGVLLAAALAVAAVFVIAKLPKSDIGEGSVAFDITNILLEGEDYEVLDCEDWSRKALGNKIPSQFTTAELMALPINERHSCRVVVGTDIDTEGVYSVVGAVMLRLRNMNPEWDEIGLDFYTTYDRVEGPWDVASAVWSTNGEWGGIDADIARNNDRSTYNTSILIKADLEEYLQLISVSTEQHSLSENKRREIFAESTKCEDSAFFKASMRYDSICSRCQEFIREDFNRLFEYKWELIENCRTALARKYGITSETLSNIDSEGMNKNWPMPDFPSWPACCN